MTRNFEKFLVRPEYRRAVKIIERVIVNINNNIPGILSNEFPNEYIFTNNIITVYNHYYTKFFDTKNDKWRWNQTGSKVATRINGYNITFWKLLTRPKLKNCSKTSDIPSHKIWIYLLTDINNNKKRYTTVWCEQGFDKNNFDFDLYNNLSIEKLNSIEYVNILKNPQFINVSCTPITPKNIPKVINKPDGTIVIDEPLTIETIIIDELQTDEIIVDKPTIIIDELQTDEIITDKLSTIETIIIDELQTGSIINESQTSDVIDNINNTPQCFHEVLGDSTFFDFVKEYSDIIPKI